MSATLEQSEAIERGGLLRDAGSLRATEKKEHREPAELLRAESRFLDVLLSNETATSDDTTDDLDKPHDDGGHWLGGIFLRLSRSGLIEEVGSVRSCRPVRHRGRLTLWGIANREAIERRRRDVRLMLDALTTNKTGESAVTDSPANSITNPPTNGVNDHGKAD